MQEPKMDYLSKDRYLNIIENEWYHTLVLLENLINVETVKFYENRGIITMHLPITTGAVSSPMGRGSDSLPVKVNLCGVDTYLADSMQFMLEYGCRMNPSGVYYIMPSFRGEKADERHLCQFFHSEVEIPGKLEDIMKLAEDYIKHLSKSICSKYGEMLKEKIGDISHLERVCKDGYEFKKISFDDAEKILIENFGKQNIREYIVEIEDGIRTINSKGEKALLKIFNEPLWITHYDYLSVPFYQAKDENGKAKNADLLMGIGETVGSGERHYSQQGVLQALEEHCVSKDGYEWYINMKKRYPIQTSGFGMGIERFLMWVLKAKDIRNMQILVRFNGVSTEP